MTEIREHSQNGLATLVSSEGWDVLMLNYLPRLGHGAVTQLHKHTETKEVFVLQSRTRQGLLCHQGRSSF